MQQQVQPTVTLTKTTPPWRSSVTPGCVCHFCGYAFCDERLLDCENLARAFTALPSCGSTEPSFRFAAKRLFASLNGCFAFVARGNTWVFAAVDRLRSIPLFYRRDAEELLIKDFLGPEVLGALNQHLNPSGVLDFLYAGYVTGADTLANNFYQLEAGQFLFWSSATRTEVGVDFYFRFLPTVEAPSDSEFVDQFEATSHNVVQRLLKFAGGRKVLLPLSGGWDSRLIAALLRAAGAKNVTCFSYGNSSSAESSISKSVADACGFPWHFVPYGAVAWRQWIDSDWMKDYWQLACSLTSLPHFQDLPAVAALLNRGILTDDVVVVPGHSGDFLAGSHIPADFLSGRPLANGVVAEKIISKHYSLWPCLAGRNECKERVTRQLLRGPGFENSAEKAVSLFELWDFSERQAKYIVNSVRAYEFLGLSWFLPLWDAELIALFLNLHLEARIGQRAYFHAIRATVFVGDNIKLARIPIANTKRTPETWGTAPRGKMLLRDLLRRLGLLSAVAGLRNRLRRPPTHPLEFESWFSGGVAPNRVRFQETIDQVSIEPHEMRELAGRFGGYSLTALDPLGILSFQVLAALLESNPLRDGAPWREDAGIRAIPVHQV